MIFIDDHIWGFDLQQALDAVSLQRREYALRYRHERDQRLSIAAYRLLQQALLQEYGINASPRFIYDNHGKPSLEGSHAIHFSISHCSDVAVCAIDNRPIGIDVETLDHYSEEVARQVMNDDEMRQILASPRPEVTFTRLWTMKESLYKLTANPSGTPIPHLLKDADKYVFTTLSTPNYILTQAQHAIQLK